MLIPKWLPVYGDINYRGDCPQETAEQVTLFGRIRRTYPDTLGLIAVHPRNEGKRNHMQVSSQKAEGMTSGASDIIIPGCPAFVCELKRRDHTKSSWQKGQIDYLRVSLEHGAFVCVALGVDGAWEALQTWMAHGKN